MSRITLALALVALVACSATTTTTPNGTSTAIGLAPGAPGASGTSSSEIWVCHGNKKPKWKHVAAPAVDAHHRHGDRISYEHQRSGWACTK
jgi:hypothetical protein